MEHTKRELFVQFTARAQSKMNVKEAGRLKRQCAEILDRFEAGMAKILEDRNRALGMDPPRKRTRLDEELGRQEVEVERTKARLNRQYVGVVDFTAKRPTRPRGPANRKDARHSLEGHRENMAKWLRQQKAHLEAEEHRLALELDPIQYDAPISFDELDPDQIRCLFRS